MYTRKMWTHYIDVMSDLHRKKIVFLMKRLRCFYLFFFNSSTSVCGYVELQFSSFRNIIL